MPYSLCFFHPQETALESQKALFLEQQAIFQSLLEDERETRRLEAEAAALKQAQEAEAMARFEEMATQLAAVQNELEESNASRSELVG